MKVKFLKEILKINLGYQYHQCVTLALANCQAKSIKLQGDLSHLYVMSRSQKARLDIVTQIKFIHKFSTRSSSVFAVGSPLYLNKAKGSLAFSFSLIYVTL